MPSEKDGTPFYRRLRRYCVAAGNGKAALLPEMTAFGGKGFNWIVRSCLLCAATSRFAEPRSSLKKVLIVAVRSCGCGVMIQGLRNLGTSCKGDVFTFFLRRAKRTKKHARGLRTSGLRGRFKALSEAILQSFSAARAETGFARKSPAKRL